MKERRAGIIQIEGEEKKRVEWTKESTWQIHVDLNYTVKVYVVECVELVDCQKKAGVCG